MKEISDQKLVEIILNGEKERFREILERFKPRVIKVVANHIPGSYLEEVVHDVFIEVYKSLRSYKNRSQLENWISKIAVRVCYRFWKERDKNRRYVQELTDVGHQSWLEQSLDSNAEDEFKRLSSSREAREILEICFCHLKASERTVLTLIYLQGHSQREAAELIGMTVVNVKVTCWRARKNLKNIVERLIERR